MFHAHALLVRRAAPPPGSCKERQTRTAGAQRTTRWRRGNNLLESQIGPSLVAAGRKAARTMSPCDLRNTGPTYQSICN